MEGAFGWISAIAEYFGQWVPRPYIVRTTHMAVKFVRGKRVKILGAGWYWYMPVFSDVFTFPVVKQVATVVGQPGVTKDGKSVAVGGMVRYEIQTEDDFRKAMTECHEIDDIVGDETLAVINNLVATKTFADITGDRQATNTDLTRQVRSVLKDYGLYVLRAQLTHFGPAHTLVHVGSPFQANSEEPEEA